MDQPRAASSVTARQVTGVTPVTPPSRYVQDWLVASRQMAQAQPTEAVPVQPGGCVLVVGAHPDDETLGAGATIAELSARGVRIHIAVMTAGEAALDHVGRAVSGLAQRRRSEFACAGNSLGAETATVLDLPDGALGEHVTETEDALGTLIRTHLPDHVLTTWWGDPHPDHAVVGQAALKVAHDCDVGVSGYLIWALHWLQPHDVLAKEQSMTLIHASARARSARADALGCYASQTKPLATDLAPILPPEIVDCRLEIMVRGPGR